MNEQKVFSANAPVTHDHIQLACDRRGQGDTLLMFIHGWTCRRVYWAPQIEYFSTHYQVMAADLPGHGDSDSGSRTDWGLATFARDIETCVRSVGAERVILIGHSMGGAVALETARRLGKTAIGVVLVDTFAVDYGYLPPEAVQAFAASFADDFPAAMAYLIEQTSTAATPPALKERLIREMAASDPAWALPVWRGLLAWDPRPAFEELQVPIHAVNGASVPESAREHCAPFVTEVLIPGAGHFLHMESPDEFNRVLDGVLKKVC